MRKWQDRAAIDDPNSWDDVANMWPTDRGTYQTCDILQAFTVSATVGAPVYAWCATPMTASYGNIEYVVDSTHIWQYDQSAKTCTDRTGGVTITAPVMAQFGDVTICVMGNATTTVKATTPGTNFSALAGAPKGACICVQSGAVLIFNTDTATDGWAASDVGDYTNWSTGESASGRLYQTPGPIIAAVPFGGSVIVFKANSMYRLTYVGGVIKWAVELLFNGIGCGTVGSACAGRSGILFCGATLSDNGSSRTAWYFFDGSSFPQLVNRFTSIPTAGRVTYNPTMDMFASHPSGAGSLDFYHRGIDAWGHASLAYGGAGGDPAVPIEGDFGARNYSSGTPPAWYNSKRYGTATNTSATSYVTTKYFGRSDRKTMFKRMSPKLWYQSITTKSASASFSTAPSNGSFSFLTTLTQSTNPATRDRFDVSGQGTTDNYGAFKFQGSGASVHFEIEDIFVESADAGRD